MVTFRTPLSVHNYVLGQLIYLQHYLMPKIVVGMLVLGFMLSFFIRWWVPGIFLLLGALLFLGSSVLKYFLARYVHGVSEIEYFFAKRNFGYTIGNSRVSMRIEALQGIELHEQYIYVITDWGGIPFISSSEVIQRAGGQLRGLSQYHELILELKEERKKSLD